VKGTRDEQHEIVLGNIWFDGVAGYSFPKQIIKTRNNGTQRRSSLKEIKETGP
jgi:hypothetical protein